MRNGLTWMLVGFLLAMVLAQLLAAGAVRNGLSDPRGELAALIEADPELWPALQRADRGDPSALATWLVRAGEPGRQRLGLAVLGAVEIAGPPGPDGRPLPDDRTAWPYRHRLRAFAAVTTGRAEIDLQLTNTLAYALAAGVEAPSAADRGYAVQLAERLERKLAAEPHHGVWDTVGCVRFLQGDWAKARDAWQAALDQLAKDDHPQTEAIRPLLDALYRGRLAAAAHNLNPPPNSPPRPLPRDLRGGPAGTSP